LNRRSCQTRSASRSTARCTARPGLVPVTGRHAHCAASRCRLSDCAVDRDGRHSGNIIKVFPQNKRWLTVYGEHPNY
jgi:hypothetical protein